MPVLLLSQLNRGSEGRQDKRPLLGDLRESGAIEQFAYVGMCDHRESYYDEKADEHEAEVIIRKHRNGPVGTIKLRFEKHITLFSDSDEAAQRREDITSRQEGFSWDDDYPFSQ